MRLLAADPLASFLQEMMTTVLFLCLGYGWEIIQPTLPYCIWCQVGFFGIVLGCVGFAGSWLNYQPFKYEEITFADEGADDIERERDLFYRFVKWKAYITLAHTILLMLWLLWFSLVLRRTLRHAERPRDKSRLQILRGVVVIVTIAEILVAGVATALPRRMRHEGKAIFFLLLHVPPLMLTATVAWLWRPSSMQQDAAPVFMTELGAMIHADTSLGVQEDADDEELTTNHHAVS